MKETDLDWLVVGGGIHGVHLAARLIGEAGVTPERLKIVDPNKHLLANWLTRTSRTGMEFLRSPSVHHLGLDPWALERFAGKRKTRKAGTFAAPYSRPSLRLFNAHCAHIIQEFALDELRVQDLVEDCQPGSRRVQVRLASGRTITAHRIVLAMGVQELLWPEWAPRRRPEVQHIFQADFDIAHSPQRVAVVGGGITAAQVSLQLAALGCDVHLVSRHAPRQHQFDSDPGWLGPKLMASFQCVTDLSKRRDIICSARHRGSIPPDVNRRLRRAIHQEELCWHETSVDDCRIRAGGATLHLAAGPTLNVDQVVLATGACTERPGGALVDKLVEQHDLPVACCGYPVVDRHLRWHRLIHVSGALAELELGPSARNVAGAKRAAQRLVAMLQLQAAEARKHTDTSVVEQDQQRALEAVQ